MPDPKVPRVKRALNISLRTQVLEILRDAILSGRIRAGSPLNERELADTMGVSKTPVREALTLLGHEGLIQVLPRKGYFVSSMGIREVHEFFELRVILECAAVEIAALRLTEAQLAELNALVPDVNAEGDIRRRLNRNVDFHYSIALLAGNRRLASLIKQLLLEMERMIAAGYVPEEHEKVMKALQERDPKRAAQAMREHILAVREKALRVAEAPIPTERPL
jgi:DNA-binding GntR family transcriptional regulator